MSALTVEESAAGDGPSSSSRVLAGAAEGVVFAEMIGAGASLVGAAERGAPTTALSTHSPALPPCRRRPLRTHLGSYALAITHTRGTQGRLLELLPLSLRSASSSRVKDVCTVVSWCRVTNALAMRRVIITQLGNLH